MSARQLLCGRPSRQWSLFLAVVMTLSPVATLRAQTPAIGSAYLTQETVVALSLKPKQILTKPAHELLPVEIAKAVGEKYLGMDAAHIVRAIGIVEPPLGSSVYYAVFLQADQPWDLDKFAPELTQHTESGEVLGRSCLVSAHPALPCFMELKGNLLVVASQGMLEKLIQRRDSSSDSVISKLVADRTATDDCYLAIDLEGLRPLINLGMNQAANEVPPEFHRFLEVPNLLESAELKLNLDISRPSSMAVHCASESDAGEVEGLLSEAVDLAKSKMAADMEQQLAPMRASDDPVERSVAAYADRAAGVYLDMFVPQRQGKSFVLFDSGESGGGAQLAPVATVGILVALLLPAVQAAREAARRNQSMNNMKMLMLAMHNYHDTRKSFPAHANYSDDGKPLLSWRVHLLPFVEEQALYDQFHLDEPWDSEHNKQLIPLMPELFASPNSQLDSKVGRTNYVAPVGDGLVFDGTKQGASLRTITDGSTNTICLLEVADDQAPVWTKPSDWQLDREDPLKGLGGVRPGVVLAGYCDGHVGAVSIDIDPQVFLALLTRNGREVIPAGM